ncbi:phosphoenolpyruvate--protein phosphotransferase [Desulfococcus sp.]|uniref:phosphoenolpyruvate--protein phosphotransferase n=1 Tax=Desulfococcus sp. TaxID=2025834 RepID=UPI003593A34D
MARKDRDHLNLLCDIGDLAALVTGSHNIETFLDSTVKLVSRHLAADVCSIYLYDETSEELVLKATVGLNPRAVGRVRMKPGEGLVGTSFEHLSPIREAHARCNPLFKYFEETDEDRFESFLSVPIQRGAQRIGVLVVQHEEADYFSERDVMALRASASQLAGAVENARLLMDLYEATGTPVETQDHAQAALKFIRGQSASEGVAHGPISFFKKSHVAFLSGNANLCSRYTVEDFHQAVNQTSRQLADLQARLSERLPESASLIFTAHFMILKDPKFIDRIVHQISEGASPPDAVRNVARHYISVFSSSSHAYIREKVSDIEDLAGRILKNLFRQGSSERQENEKGKIVVAGELYPSEILKLASEDVQGIILVKGGITSHVSILARSLKIPLVIADHPNLMDLPEETPVLLDANVGNIYVRPDKEILLQFAGHKAAGRVLPKSPPTACPITCTLDGTRIRLLANINLLSELSIAKELNAEGIGLYRTEFPFIVRPTFPSEEEQYLVYKHLFDEMAGREITIRTLDISGDKALVYSNATSGKNPDLGLRSIRFSLSNRPLFEQQLRAILRAGAEAGRLRIMFPMISSLDEFREARRIVDDCLTDLAREDLPHHPKPFIGMMVEVPSVVEIMPALGREADFFSIGTNDFIQYTLAVDRTNEKVAGYYRAYHPAVLRGLARIVRAATAAGREIAVCGEMGHEAEYIPFLLGIGIRTLSVGPQFLPAVHDRISGMRLRDAERIAEALLSEDTLAGAFSVLEAQSKLMDS